MTGFKRSFLVQLFEDVSYDMLARDVEKDGDLSVKPIRVCTSEETLPFADKTFDLVLSNCQLHWVNDLPGCFTQIRRVLKDDGLFLGAIFGSFRSYCFDAEQVKEH
jgi:NADH dehydrogenase [ubiquinone] 1 alpha subcomplex assembly factor 5